jgi:hypothetical protein
VKLEHWEFTGIFFIIVLGSLLHFAFELSGYWKGMGLIAAVNESVWEHLKLGFWPAVIYALIEYPYLRENNFIIAKAIGILLIPLFIAGLFYFYTAIVGYNIVALDILIFFIAVIMGQVASYSLLKYELLEKWNLAGLAVVVLLAVLFMIFTVYPPHVPLFQDPVTGGYGIV